jgi:hypothetical protein
VRGIDGDRVTCACIDPAAKHTTARKNQRVNASDTNHRQLQITIKRRGSRSLPFHPKTVRDLVATDFELAQFVHDTYSPRKALSFGPWIAKENRFRNSGGLRKGFHGLGGFRGGGSCAPFRRSTRLVTAKITPSQRDPHPVLAFESGRASRHLHGRFRLPLTVSFPNHAAEHRSGM